MKYILKDHMLNQLIDYPKFHNPNELSYYTAAKGYIDRFLLDTDLCAYQPLTP
jgi:hypothetical protein